jgi:nitrate reductase cytochrome c-type subunit
MASKHSMTLEKAVALRDDVARARRKWGRQASVNYTQDDMLDALDVLAAADEEQRGVAAGLQKEELTKVKRQLAACQNREKAAAARKKPKRESQTLQLNYKKPPVIDEHVGEDEEVT